jgi:hypothetical protein
VKSFNQQKKKRIVADFGKETAKTGEGGHTLVWSHSIINFFWGGDMQVHDTHSK